MTQPPDGLPPLRAVIAKLDLRARKALGQNYILDFNILRRIARAGGALEGRHVIEVGPGPGGLTRALFLEGAATVTVIERDERFRPALDEIAAHYPGRLTMLFRDACTVPFAAIAPQGARVIANLPYNVGTALLVDWLRAPSWPPWYDRLVLMFQREVAARLTASPGSRAYGRLSVLAQWRTGVRQVLHLPRDVFTPKPKVASTLVEIIPNPGPPEGVLPAYLEKITAAAFAQRRKMLRTSLRQITSDAQALLAEAQINPELRADALSVQEFMTLARLLALKDRAG